MAKIYKGQTLLTLSLTATNPDTNNAIDITGYSYVYLNVLYPDRTTSAVWTATVISASLGTFYYNNFTAGSFSTIGTYCIQPEISIGGKIAKGETIKIKVYDVYQ